jgi:hypothetical protein
MKIWSGYGTEHSQNLVMIGHFMDLAAAEQAEDALSRLGVLIGEEVSAKRMELDGGTSRFSKHVLDALSDLKIYDLGPRELEQFAYDVRVKRDGTDVIVTTDEPDISAFLRVLVDHKAKVEVYSAHFYTEEKFGRGK